MKKTLLSLLALMLLSAPAVAQAVQKGYYRIQNFQTKRYIFIVDYKTKGLDASRGNYDIDALRTRGEFSNVVSDPSTVYYIENMGGTDYNLKAQGKDAYEFVGYYLTARQVKDSSGKTHFTASGIYKGIEVYLSDSDPSEDDPESPYYIYDSGYLMTKELSYSYKLWDILPVSATDDSNYFGIQPEVTVGGQHYAPFYASFPFTPASAGMKAYTVTKVDGNMAVYTEVQGKVAGGTPVIIACPGATPSDNRINIEMEDTGKPANLLSGEYFNSSDFCEPSTDPKAHYNALPWDAATMRILGITKEGKLGFVKSTAITTIPRNKAYLVVSADAPDEITLMTQAEYDEEKAKDAVTVVARSYSRVYGEPNPAFEYDVTVGTLKGQPQLTCEATETTPVGTYPIIVDKGTATNDEFTGVNGTLTITEAPLTITARSYSINQGDELPVYEADYEGFKNGETADVLTKQPVFVCELPDSNPYPAGIYDIVVSDAEAQNYAITYVNGKLEIIETQGIAAVTVGANKPVDIYAVDGRCVRRAATTLAGLPRGLYIVEGRKVIVR